MRTFKPTSARLCRVGLAFAALMSIAAVAKPAAADDWNHRHHRHRHDDGGSFSFGFSAPGYYDPPDYYYAPPPRQYYYPPPVYYPPPRYYEPGPSFNLVIPLGSHH
jgi:hypothetical protein